MRPVGVVVTVNGSVVVTLLVGIVSRAVPSPLTVD
jgi:hypothetical protein